MNTHNHTGATSSLFNIAKKVCLFRQLSGVPSVTRHTSIFTTTTASVGNRYAAKSVMHYFKSTNSFDRPKQNIGALTVSTLSIDGKIKSFVRSINVRMTRALPM
jgi:hypothetical protein